MVNRRNYQWAKEYLSHLAQDRQLAEMTVSRYWFYLKHLLLWADDVLLFNAPEIKQPFPVYLSGIEGYNGSDSLAPATLKKIVNTTKRFLTWLRGNKPREAGSLSQRWIDDLCPPRMADPVPDHEFVTLEEVLRLASVEIDEDDLALRRDSAGAALLYLSGMRGGALGSLPLEAIDIKERSVKQWPSLGVRTKNGKSATTYLLQIPELLAVVAEWDDMVRSQLPETAMWFTPVISCLGNKKLSAQPAGSNRNIAIARRMDKLFAAAGLDYKSPHKFRHGHAVYGLQRARTMADYKAVSMNLMHGDIRVTDSIYARLATEEVRDRIAAMGVETAVEYGMLQGSALGGGLSDGELAQALVIAARRLVR